MSTSAGPEDKAGFPHYMIKEIYENPRAVRETVLAHLARGSGGVALDVAGISEEEFRRVQRINIAASGSSRHAGLAGRVMINQLAGIPVDVDFASEFEYRNPVTGPDELTVSITQSGETADTTRAQRAAKAKGSKTLAICNVLDSTIAREADAVIYTLAGPEISVASTKSFTAQLTALFLLAVYLGEAGGTLARQDAARLLDDLLLLPDKLETALTCDAQCKELAAAFCRHEDFLYVGRGVHYPIALDGALKLKEVSYIHAEGYPAGELKHGPAALVEEAFPVVFLATRDARDPASVLRYEKTIADLKHVLERQGSAIVVANSGDEQAPRLTANVVFVPNVPELLLPMVEIVPLQLLAYHIAVRRGVDVDRPRNLVKSVMVE